VPESLGGTVSAIFLYQPKSEDESEEPRRKTTDTHGPAPGNGWTTIAIVRPERNKVNGKQSKPIHFGAHKIIVVALFEGDCGTLF
jgi:hypothetical protein